MLRRFWPPLGDYLRSHPFSYVLMVTLFALGMLFGAVAVNVLAPDQEARLQQYIGGYLHTYSRPEAPVRSLVVQEAAGANALRTAGLMWLLGLTVVGAPVVAVLLFARGFALGFTVGFLVQQWQWKGLGYAFAALLPHNLLAVPALIVVAVSALGFAGHVVRSRLILQTGDAVWPEMGRFTLAAATGAGLLVLAALVQGYITPEMLNLAVRWTGSPG